MPRSKDKGAPGLTCGSSDCPHGKHTYRPIDKDADPSGCVECGETTIDFERMYRLNLRDLPFTCQQLRTEFIRHEFWIRPINQRAQNYALRKGMTALLAGTAAKILKHVGAIPNEYEWNRVPIRDELIQNPYQYAYHATGTCCRRCMRYLYGIPRDRELNTNEVSYFTQLVNEYLRQRLRDIPADPQKVPPIRQS